MPSTDATPELTAFLERSQCAREMDRVYWMIGGQPLSRRELLSIFGDAFPTDIIDETIVELCRLGAMSEKHPPLPIQLGGCGCPQCGHLRWGC